MKKLNQFGYGVVEIILIIVALGIVGGTGFYVYNANKKDVKISDSSIQKSLTKNESDDKSTVPTDINYEVPVEITKKSDVSKLIGASESFKSYVTGLVPETPNPPKDCEDSPLTYVVFTIIRDEFASVASGECGGGAKLVWKNEGGSWKEVLGYQDTPRCDDVNMHKIPSKIIEECLVVKSETDFESVKNTNQ